MGGQRKRKDVQQPETGKKPLSICVKDISNLTPQDTQTLVQELRIQQVELEARVEKRTSDLQKAYEKSEADWRILDAMMENVPVGIMITGGPPDYPIAKVSRYAREITGQPPSSLLGHKAGYHQRAWGVLLPDGKRPSAGQMPLYRSSHHGEVVRDEEFILKTVDGRKLIILASAAPIRDSQGNTIAAISVWRDITKRKRMEQSLNEYAKRITQVQEEERKRVAYELHDDTAQYLSILKLQLDSLLKSGKIQDPEILEKLQYLEKDADRAFNDVRRYSHELRPVVLEHLGLQAALEQIADDYTKLKQLTVEVNVEGLEPELPEEIKLGLFRIAQEALNNARKHAKAGSANIGLQFTDTQMRIIVHDNGIGFNVQKAASRSGQKGSLGLISMQERAKLIGADLRIESLPGKGTAVIAEVKL